MIRALALSGWLALASLGSAAQTTLYFREGQRVDPQEVKQILENPDGGRTRSIRVLDAGTSAGAGAGTGSAAVAAAGGSPSALSLPVQFDFDSANILPSARSQLDALAEGVKLLPPNRLVVIEGHTDAAGADDYNQDLSRRRAAAVKQYLVQAHGIDARRLRDTGVGKREPITGTDPYAPENRRVQFRGG